MVACNVLYLDTVAVITLFFVIEGCKLIQYLSLVCILPNERRVHKQLRGCLFVLVGWSTLCIKTTCYTAPIVPAMCFEQHSLQQILMISQIGKLARLSSYEQFPSCICTSVYRFTHQFVNYCLIYISKLWIFFVLIAPAVPQPSKRTPGIGFDFHVDSFVQDDLMTYGKAICDRQYC